ncbi:hypothetical protein DV515_00003729 [Chloebia gouldiae]|uniref:Transmembrane protein 255B n=1 Tax=Chloebia gouldiae TaxID=44316 RepID=A0A3L8SSL4_CHLGU|nr:hypothetical protein DV515_00003729 [Chloebia gouldiae]
MTRLMPWSSLQAGGQFAKRKKTSLWFTVALLVVSVFILTIGLAATTRTENVTVGGYYPGIVLGFGSFLGIVGIYLVENRRQIGAESSTSENLLIWERLETVSISPSSDGIEGSNPGEHLAKCTVGFTGLHLTWLTALHPSDVASEEASVISEVCANSTDWSLVDMHSTFFPSPVALSRLVASIVFISFGAVAAFCCAIVDGVFAARHIEPRPLYNKRCQFYSSGIGFLYDAYQTEVTCHTLNSKCQLKVKSNTCYCCDLYNCENSDQSSSYYEFLGVSSCQDVLHLYRLLWSSTVLNIIGLFLGIITAAILGAFKDMVPLSQIAFSAAPPPQILYNPAQQILTYAGFCPSAATISTYPSYPLPLQPASNFPGTSSTDISLSEETQPPSQSSSSYGLPPNAPALYTPTYCLPGEKPPPYAP